jgi:hypothetical protein
MSSGVFESIFDDTFEKIDIQVQDDGQTDMDESVLDFPEGKTLAKDVWSKSTDGKYVLNDETFKKAKSIIDWAVEEFKLENPKSRIVGSICSNTFNDSSDIDIHISADNITKKNGDEINKKMISAFKKKFVGKKSGEIGSHPFEIYAQPNINQDIMSVGCYDFDNKKWLSGPEILDKNFNPYEKYYDGIQKHLDDISDEIRKHVFMCGELATVMDKISGEVDKDDDFRKKIEKKIDDATKKARKLFEDVRKKRSIASAPKSAKDAKEKRTSMEWKIADSSFKYLDKLGYIATLLTIAKIGENESLSSTRKAKKIIMAIHENLFNKDRTGYADVNKD